MGTPFMNLSQGLTRGAPAQPGFPPRASGLTPEEYRELIRRILMAQQTANVLPQQSPFMDLQTLLPQAQQLGAAMVPAPAPEPTTFRGRLAEGIRRGVAIPPEGMPSGTSQSLAYGLMQGLASGQQARQRRIEEQRTLPARQMQTGMELMDWYKRMTARPAIGTLRPIVDEEGNVIYAPPEQAVGQLVPPKEPTTPTPQRITVPGPGGKGAVQTFVPPEVGAQYPVPEEPPPSLPLDREQADLEQKVAAGTASPQDTQRLAAVKSARTEVSEFAYQQRNQPQSPAMVNYTVNQLLQPGWEGALTGLTAGNQAFRNQVMEELASRNIPLEKLSASSRSMGEASRAIVPKMRQFIALLDKPEYKAELGVVTSRWNEFMTGKVGTGPLFNELRTTVGFIVTAEMRMHVGARGGVRLLDEFWAKHNTAKMDAPTLKAGLQAAADFLTTYGDMLQRNPYTGAFGQFTGTFPAQPQAAPGIDYSGASDEELDRIYRGQ